MPTDPKDAGLKEYVVCLAVAPNGELYVGTRFAGVRHITNRGPEILALPGADPVTRSLQFDQNGRLYIGTATGLFRRDPNGAMTRISTRTDFINSLSLSPDGKIWIGLQYGADAIEPNGRTTTLFDDFDPVNGVVTDKAGRVWLATEHTLRCSSGGFVTVWPTSNGLKQQRFLSLYHDRDDNIWYGSLEGISRVRPQAGPEQAPELLRLGEVSAMFEDREGSLWIGTTAGLHRLKDVNAVTWGAPEGLPSDSTPSVVTSPDGTVFVFTRNPSGVAEWRDGRVARFDELIDGPSCVTRNGTLWVGTTAQLSRVKDGKVDLFGTKDGLLASWISAVAEDDQGLLLAFSGMDGLRRWDGHRSSYYRLKDGTEFKVPYFLISMYSAPDESVWAAGFDGLWHLDHGTVTRYTTPTGAREQSWYKEHPITSDSFRTVISPQMSDYVLCSIADDGHGTFWIGSPRGGLTRMRDGAFASVTTRDGLDSNQIYAVLLDDIGGVWMASAAGILHASASELNRIADRHDVKLRCEVFARDDGLRNDECRATYQPAAAKASDGTLWFATMSGVVAINPREIRHSTFVPPVHIESVLVDGVEFRLSDRPHLAPSTQKIEFRFTALSLRVPQRVRCKYQLVGYDADWVDAGTARTTQYTRLSAGKYTFRVKAANDAGVWNEVPTTFPFTLEPHFYETGWFIACFILGCGAAVFGLHRWRVHQLESRETELQRRVLDRTAELSAANERLTREITDRERAELEVSRIHRELITASHQAGMAEVATGVLHNVGNALNSVNVSADMLARTLRHSKVRLLRRMSELLREHQADLVPFLTTDPKGRLFSEHLDRVTAAAETDQGALEQELRDLRKNIDHIRQVVVMQQEYARAAIFAEPASMSDLVEDALKINAAVLGRTGVDVVRDFDLQTPSVTVQKHKVLQILVNLIQNAEHACRESGKDDRTIRIKVAPNPHGVCVEVKDNGIGMAPDVRAKLFTYGFTTRKDGHGFGLHNGAIAANELGGSLEAHSEGLGTGATFTLILPLAPPPSEA